MSSGWASSLVLYFFPVLVVQMSVRRLNWVIDDGFRLELVSLPKNEGDWPWYHSLCTSAVSVIKNTQVTGIIKNHTFFHVYFKLPQKKEFLLSSHRQIGTIKVFKC